MQDLECRCSVVFENMLLVIPVALQMSNVMPSVFVWTHEAVLRIRIWRICIILPDPDSIFFSHGSGFGFGLNLAHLNKFALLNKMGN